MTGNGEKTMQVLVVKHNNVTDEVNWAQMNKLFNSNMGTGEELDPRFMEKTLACAEREKMGEPISDRRCKDICVESLTTEYKDISMIVYQDPTFDIDRMQSTMSNLYQDDLPHNSGAKVAGGGVVLIAPKHRSAGFVESKGPRPDIVGEERTTQTANPPCPTTSRRTTIPPRARQDPTVQL